jgi:F0F1-type ATP synthase membrane subunit c/vacuolar-type H+-ATPase subunit K
MEDIRLQCFRLVGAGLATIALGGVGMGIGMVFSGYLQAVVRNPSMKQDLFGWAMLGFALTESVGLIAVMVIFFMLFG